MNNLPILHQVKIDFVQVRIFRIPRFYTIDFTIYKNTFISFFYRNRKTFTNRFSGQRNNLRHELVGIFYIIQKNLCQKSTVTFGIDHNTFDIFARLCFEPHRPKNATEDPEIRISLGFIHRFVSRMFINLNLQKVLFTKFQRGSNVVAKAVISALMNRAGQFAIDFYFGVGHRTIENNLNLLSLPCCRNFKLVFVQTRFLPAFFVFGMAVIVLSKSL